MNINYTKIYRLWFILTSLAALGLLTTFFVGYSPESKTWNIPMHNLHTIFVGMLLSAVFVRIYMALNKINAVPLMHLIRAKSIIEVLVALAYIAMCSVLLMVLFTEIYLLLSVNAETFIRESRDTMQVIFAGMIMIHVFYVFYLNTVKKTGSLLKLFKAETA